MVCRLIDNAKIIHQSFQEGGLPGLRGGTADTCFYNYHFSISGINQVEIKNDGRNSDRILDNGLPRRL